MTNNRRVYVQSLAYLGVGEVLRERRDGRLVVETPTGRTHRVRPEDCRDLGQQHRPSQPLETAPDYGRSEGEAQPKPETERLPAYLAWLRKQLCARCGCYDAEASHHPAEKQGSMGLKAPDARAIPLCRSCHMKHHQKPLARDWVEEQIAASTRAWVRSLGDE